MQQHLPFTVLKQEYSEQPRLLSIKVATTPTVYGIETYKFGKEYKNSRVALQQHLPFTVLKLEIVRFVVDFLAVATTPTVYGIETNKVRNISS